MRCQLKSSKGLSSHSEARVFTVNSLLLFILYCVTTHLLHAHYPGPLLLFESMRHALASGLLYLCTYSLYNTLPQTASWSHPHLSMSLLRCHLFTESFPRQPIDNFANFSSVHTYSHTHMLCHLFLAFIFFWILITNIWHVLLFFLLFVSFTRK